MNIDEAESIVQQVGNVIASRPFDDDHWMCWARPIVDLPCSIGRIKYAFFRYAEFLVRKDLIMKVTDSRGLPITETMISVYGMLGEFREDAQEINKALFKLYTNPDNYSEEEIKKIASTLSKKHGIETIYRPPNSKEAIIEFNNYLADIQNNYYPNKFKELDHPFLAYSGTIEHGKYHGVSKLAWDKEFEDNFTQKYGDI